MSTPTEIQFEGKIHGLADIIDWQYVLRLQSSMVKSETNFANSLLMVNAIKPTLELWHQRMGHLRYKNVFRLPAMATGIDVKRPLPDSICGPCMKRRQQRKPFKAPMPRGTKFLEKVHSDLGGSFSFFYNGMIYYVSFKDDTTGTYHAYSLKLKSDTFEKIKEHIDWASQRTGMQLKAFHSDGGEEYNNQQFQDWMKEHHVKWRPSAPYTPEQNEKVKRLNYTLMSSVCLILAAMKLSKSLWSEILLAVCYLKNQSPNVDGITPFESLNQTQPDLCHLRTLGAHAWVHIPKEKRKKLDKRSWQEIHVGYEGSNQYRIYDPCTGKIHITRDVTIDEKNLFDRTAFQSNELVNDK